MRGFERPLLIALLSIYSLVATGQIYSKVRFLHPDGQTAVETISIGFYSHPLAPDTTCIEGLYSVTFVLEKTSVVDSIQFSAGVPENIIQPLLAVIKGTDDYWMLDQTKPIRIILPLYITYSGLCPDKNRRNTYYQSASQMFNYGQPLTNYINAQNYLHSASAMAEGIVLAPMIIKGKISEIYQPYQKK